MLPAWREKAIVEIFLRLPRIILVDSEETYLLGYRVCDSGIRLEVSGPESLLMHEHTVTECDGSPLVLRRD